MSRVLAELPAVIANNLAIIVLILVVLVGLGIGLKDVLRFSITRAWAISGVCFRQSIRRRVLWLTPLVILGVLIVAQFQKPVDAQDAVRQTTSYCLFATGLLVAIVTIILACTNLPQEIENRVIYTVATKPTTRLEIVIGKVIGFCRVSFWILVIMGLFSWGYLRFSDWRLRSAISAQLDAGGVDQISRPTLEYYRDHGTLHARELVLPTKLSVYSHEPMKEDDRWVASGGEGEILVPFLLDRAQFPPPLVEQRSAIGPGLISNQGDAQLVVRMRSQPVLDLKAPTTSPTTAPTTEPANPRARPSITVEFRNANFDSVFLAGTWEVLPGDWRELRIAIPYDGIQKLLPDIGPRQVYVVLIGMGEGYEYTISKDNLKIDLPTAQPTYPVGEVMFGGRIGQYGQQLKGGGQRVAVFEFHDDQLPAQRAYPFELRVGLESARNEDAVEEDYATKITLDFYNRTNGNRSTRVLYPENNRPIYFEMGSAAVVGGQFDVVVRMHTPGWAGLRPGKFASLKLVRNDQAFAWNLIKSLTILWLMSLLVTIISIFCSTFLSWPIAVVLTLVILFGRWGAMQLGDVTDAGFGRRVAEDMFKGSNAATYRTVSETVDILVKTMGIVSSVLPDVSQFGALEDIQQGVAVPPATLLASLQVALGFGIPLLVLAYIFLKYKEVAP
ncbi:MAG TPA: hypothetical protein VGP99_00200 [Tepidisphaeraceae bacterium]|nr:hypothetical protein [Tepidisphaeraceae bacterium]